MRLDPRHGLLALALTLSSGSAGSAAPDTPPDAQWSVLAPRAPHSLLLDGTRAGSRIVAVGERGHVLVSRDEGRTWEQRRVPTRSMLTAVFFQEANLGWAVGHDAVILRTRNAGDDWERVYYAPEEERPLLDVYFQDASRGFAVGAYGFYLETADGGDSWTPRDILANEEQVVDEFYGGGIAYHLNQVAADARGRLFLAGEAGSIFRSADRGRTWEQLSSPYEGSFFGLLPLEDDALLVFGLRGHLFRSEDAGVTWSAVPTGTQAMLTRGLRRSDGTVLVAGLSGTILRSRDGGRTFDLEQRADRFGIAGLVPTADGALILLGDGGALRVED